MQTNVAYARWARWSSRMPRTTAVVIVGYALTYAAAVLLGRMSVPAGEQLALIWPAAGVSFLWLKHLLRLPGAWRRRDLYVSIGLVGLLTFILNTSAHVPLGTNLASSVGNIVQSLAAAAFYLRGSDSGLLNSRRRLLDLLAASILGAVASLPFGLVIAFLSGADWANGPAWLLRNMTGIFLVGIVGLRVLRRHPDELAKQKNSRLLSGVSTLTTCFVVWFAFFVTPAVPLSFLFVSLVIWVASTRGVNETAVYAMAVSAVSIMLTLANIGPFAQQPIMARAALGQGLSLVLCMTAMSIVLAREEQSRLVSQVRASQAATIAQAVLMDGIVATMDDGLVVFSEDGSVLLANATAHDLLNWPEDSWDNAEALAPLFSPDGSQSLLVNQALRSQEPEPVDVMPVRPEGAGERIISARAVPFAHEGTVQVVVVLFDVTEQRRRTAELTSFAGVIAHDLLNPLGAVEGWTEMLADEIADAHPGLGEGALRRITASAARMRGIISGLLSYSVAREGTLSRIDLDLRELVQDVVDARSSAAIAMGAQIPDFRIDVDASVRVDRALVAQVLDNLIGNAAKYTASSERPVIEVSAMRAVNGWVTVRVEDRGIGLPPGQEDVVFEEFHRVPEHRGSYVGTGLGLSICKRIVERHGGRVAAHRRQGGGSSFVLTLPAAGSLVPTVLDQDAVIEQARASSAAAEKAAMVPAQQDQLDWVLAQPRSRLDAHLADSSCLQGSRPGKQSSGGNTSERPTP